MDFIFDLIRELPKLNLLVNLTVLYILVYHVLPEVKKSNGRLTKMETWQVGHEKQDDERHEQVLSWLKDVASRVNKVVE